MLIADIIFGAVATQIFRRAGADLSRRNAEDAYRLPRYRTFSLRLASRLPLPFREPFAETFLRRANASGPAAEHILQYLLSAGLSKVEATVVKGADHFCERQYREYLNPTMGVFAITATQVALAAGASAFKLRAHRTVRMTMNPAIDGTHPILALDHQSVAKAILPMSGSKWK